MPHTRGIGEADVKVIHGRCLHMSQEASRHCRRQKEEPLVLHISDHKLVHANR